MKKPEDIGENLRKKELENNVLVFHDFNYFLDSLVVRDKLQQFLLMFYQIQKK
ncbi:MAG: hypothetical protein ACLUQ0_03390 [Enterococcus italicus]|mgnify:CR=1 FL=1|jgi:hypothetical protein|uniref:Uncharacterized protein n=1 Tax=Enterococcus italicus (strain DSM 15952 / CCUG 50447 / LMG 22039 / TP 1.5) TaxID=888064 RepID=E6LIX9_ENTI1|nr:hypothetical protein [Enterococcus italicus]EFU72840.1 hypothetical protein HMPREF9088_2319 [Enterococcus italicus DSM 15952]MCM6882088.1 hypothetical protein [Enterococcus italicus]OJG56311.1 hypothetical protein RT43_GL001962 [Enterococcus italicus DSM 15952]